MSLMTTAAGPASVEPRLAIDRPARRASIGARALHLEPRGFDLLAALAGEPGRVVPKNELFERIWGPRVVGDAALTQAIARLRRELAEAGGDAAWVRTVHGVGYAFDGPIVEAPVSPPAAPAVPAPAAAAALAGADPTPSPPARSVSKAARRGLWLSGFAAGVAVLVVAWLLFAPSTTSGPQRLAIVPFDIDVQARDLEYGELALPGLVGDVIEGRTRLDVVDASRVRRGLANLGVASDAGEAETVRAIQDLFGADHVLFARLDGQAGQLALEYTLYQRGSDVRRGRTAAGGVGALAASMASTLAESLHVAYAAGIPVRRLAADEFVNEAFARGMQALLSGELPAAERYFLAALQDAPDNGWIRYELGNTRRQQGRFEDARPDYAQAMALGTESNDRNLVGVAETGLGLLAWRAGNLTQAEAHFLRARERFEEVDNRANLAAALGNLGILADNRGDLDAAQALYEEALALYREKGERAGESAVYSNLAVIARRSGQLDRAATLQRRALELQRRAGLGSMQRFSATHLAEIERQRGQWERAAPLLDEAAGLAERGGDALGSADIAAARAALAADMGDSAAAERLEGEALAGYRALANPAGELRLHLQQALRRLEQSAAAAGADVGTPLPLPPNAGALRAALEAARDIARALPDPAAQARTELLLAWLDPDDAATALRTALSRAQAGDGDAQRVLAHWLLALRTGDADALRQAYAIAGNGGDLRRQALLALELARWRLRAGDTAVEPLLGRASAWRPEHPQVLEVRACRRLLQGDAGEARALLARAAGLPGARTAAGWCPQVSVPM